MALDETQIGIVNGAKATISVLEAKMISVAARVDAEIGVQRAAIATLEAQKSAELSEVQAQITAQQALITALIGNV